MSLTDRERFLYHLSVLMTVDVIGKEGGKESMDIDGMMAAITKNRCRKLTTKDILSVYDAVEEEAMAATAVYEEYALDHAGRGIGFPPVSKEHTRGDEDE
jgi:hypothetical protein